jgi:hypothetical protein
MCPTCGEGSYHSPLLQSGLLRKVVQLLIKPIYRKASTFTTEITQRCGVSVLAVFFSVVMTIDWFILRESNC